MRELSELELETLRWRLETGGESFPEALGTYKPGKTRQCIRKLSPDSLETQIPT